VPTVTIFAKVFESLPTICADVFATKVATELLAGYLVFLKPTLVALDPITSAVTVAFAYVSTTACVPLILLKNTSDTPVTATPQASIVAMAFVR